MKNIVIAVVVAGLTIPLASCYSEAQADEIKQLTESCIAYSNPVIKIIYSTEEVKIACTYIAGKKAGLSRSKEDLEIDTASAECFNTFPTNLKKKMGDDETHLACDFATVQAIGRDSFK